jgi:hypothetical protein
MSISNDAGDCEQSPFGQLPDPATHVKNWHRGRAFIRQVLQSDPAEGIPIRLPGERELGMIFLAASAAFAVGAYFIYGVWGPAPVFFETLAANLVCVLLAILRWRQEIVFAADSIFVRSMITSGVYTYSDIALVTWRIVGRYGVFAVVGVSFVLRNKRYIDVEISDKTAAAVAHVLRHTLDAGGDTSTWLVTPSES